MSEKQNVGFTPLHMARIHLQNDAAKCLADHGADPTIEMPGPVGSERTYHFFDRLVPRLMTYYKVPGVSIVGIEDRRIAWNRHYGVRCW